MAETPTNVATGASEVLDALIIGAGFSGLYQLHRLRFPNLLMLYGPQNPTAFCNGPTCAELQGDWVANCLSYVRDHGLSRIEATAAAGRSWTQHMAELAAGTLLPLAESWYLGANVPGKPRQLLHHLGLQEYLAFCRESAENGYAGFALR